MREYSREELSDYNVFREYLNEVVQEEVEGYFDRRYSVCVDQALRNTYEYYSCDSNSVCFWEIRPENILPTAKADFKTHFIDYVVNQFNICNLHEKILEPKMEGHERTLIRLRLLEEIANHHDANFRDSAIDGKVKIDGTTPIDGFDSMICNSICSLFRNKCSNTFSRW